MFECLDQGAALGRHSIPVAGEELGQRAAPAGRALEVAAQALQPRHPVTTREPVGHPRQHRSVLGLFVLVMLGGRGLPTRVVPLRRLG